MKEAVESGEAEADEGSRTGYRSDNIGNATRLIDVLMSTIRSRQITAGSKEISTIVQELYRFQATALCSTDDLSAVIVPEEGERTLSVPGQPFSGAEIPSQKHLRHIKSQQKSLSNEREKIIQGIQRLPDVNTTGHSAAVYSVLNGFREQNVHITATDSETLAQDIEPSMDVQFGQSTTFSEVGRRLAESFTLKFFPFSDAMLDEKPRVRAAILCFPTRWDTLGLETRALNRLASPFLIIRKYTFERD